jgi:hypothetical protein
LEQIGKSVEERGERGREGWKRRKGVDRTGGKEEEGQRGRRKIYIYFHFLNYVVL